MEDKIDTDINMETRFRTINKHPYARSLPGQILCIRRTIFLFLKAYAIRKKVNYHNTHPG